MNIIMWGRIKLVIIVLIIAIFGVLNFIAGYVAGKHSKEYTLRIACDVCGKSGIFKGNDELDAENLSMKAKWVCCDEVWYCSDKCFAPIKKEIDEYNKSVEE